MVEKPQQTEFVKFVLRLQNDLFYYICNSYRILVLLQYKYYNGVLNLCCLNIIYETVH